ncbi:unnamed protein product [Cercopithifilaria johnstoni]|uniref:Uncharacterized protein n=1 Tax=Cercopithifilaria johnstoni TaxID=2874296 RepID=A0A8J2LWT5_9BILA|nr:unnamed protein product [Cercopithifilaria johnstoni]
MRWNSTCTICTHGDATSIFSSDLSCSGRVGFASVVDLLLFGDGLIVKRRSLKPGGTVETFVFGQSMCCLIRGGSSPRHLVYHVGTLSLVPCVYNRKARGILMLLFSDGRGLGKSTSVSNRTV